MSLQGHHRHITLRHERHLIRGTSPALAPGEARISSYYLPSLPAGEYSLAIDQTITTPTKDAPKKAVPATRKIEVLAPAWALSAAGNGDSETTNASEEEAAVVLSVFPASGQVAPSFRTLPHMVLRDAQIPWVRTVSKQTSDLNNSIPWFALIVFSADELEVEEDDRKDYFSAANASINGTLGWDITVDLLEKVNDPKLANFIPKPLPPDVQAKTRTSLIPVKADVFAKLFPPNPKINPSAFDVSPYRFMSHVRTVATEGTLSAGIVADNDHDPKLAGTQTVSVIVSPRLGPTNVKVPTPVLAHLVSLQGIDGRDPSSIKDKKHVLMTSLFSWTYTALPPGAPDVVSMLQYLGSEGKGLTVLRTDMVDDAATEEEKPPAEKKPSMMEEMITRRQNDGYNLVRHRVITGEQTAAMYRGPLTPTRVPYPLHNKISFQSNFGTDLQILDTNLGLMDISYASAWQLGKTLAMADPAFTAALSRLRMLVHREALEEARKRVVKTLRAPVLATEEGASPVHTRLSVFSDQNPHISYAPKEEIKSDVVDIVKALNSINDTVHEVGTAFSTNRWRRRNPLSKPEQSSGDDDLMSLTSDHIHHQLPEHALVHMLDNANTPVAKEPYNYHTIPNNTDYAVIQEWVLNKLHLSSIPAHYYLPDPTYVPEETLRFFHVDLNWMDALVDGALSLANHLASKPDEDYCRSALKDALSRYFKSPIIKDYRQQNPVYGFILRSKLLVQFPDLAVTAEFSKEVSSTEDWDKVQPKAPILVQRRLGPDMMLVLMDRKPPNLSGITFTLPAHQQTFIAAFALNDKEVKLQCKRIYATGADAPLPEPSREKRQEDLGMGKNPRPTNDLFDWDARMLRIKDYAELIHDNLKERMPKDYLAPGPTSAVFSLQLNEPVYTLSVTAEKPKVGTEEELDSWMMLNQQPEYFQFYPPPFPITAKSQTKEVLSTASKLPSFPATRLKVVEPPSFQRETKQDDFALIADPSLKMAKSPAPIHKTDFPEFDFGLFPIGHKDDGYIPCKNIRPIDLVFSIVRIADPDNWRLRIKRWDLVIKIGNPRKGSDIPPGNYTRPRALLRSDMPDGPPPHMLSNLRYNVLISKWDVGENLLNMAIIPRSKWGVGLRDTPDASFLLPMANVYPWDIPDGGEYTVEITLKGRMVDHDEVEYVYDYSKQFTLREK
ncbi:unnamed protein product [Clonostachys rosea]|uniref:Uncharacterized protein n=1 Tax=Bionectria ochroleuca TaxID=29856 RepID=A0ABY6U3K1_BIOOC|nr:unnamed protein product [Clonostachys rosea]